MKDFDPSAVLAGLKDFQRDTVEYTFRRLYTDSDRVDRFLVADEVGLGKTLVARGVIAKAIVHLREKVNRIRVVYICSNAEIARQNLARLNVTGAEDVSLASRLTLLPTKVPSLNRKLSFVSFTPGTSFKFGHSQGIWRERALLYRLLERAWGTKVMRAAGGSRVFQGSVQGDFRKRIWQVDPSEINEELAKRFASRVSGNKELRRRFVELREAYKGGRRKRDAHASLRSEFIAELRQQLAEVCVDYLEPDLVILDEFQRFKDVLHGDDQAAQIAQSLFSHSRAKVLLLSATPYKMYTLYEEQADDDHYQDFRDTLRFLAPREADDIVEAFRDYRTRLLLDRGSSVADARARAEAGLRRVMTRTERLSLDSNPDGMISERLRELALGTKEVARYLQLSELSNVLGVHDVLEIWKSAPYLLSFMEGYKLKQRVQEATEGEGLRMSRAAEHLRWSDMNDYQEIDLGNSRMRAFAAEVLDGGAWRLLWLLPSLPYYKAREPFDAPLLASFTKRLVFSAWTVVPKAIAALLSYEAERRVFEQRDRFRSYEDRQNTPRLLEAKREGDRLTGMALFSLVYPSPTLAETGDPLSIARELGKDANPDAAEVLEVVRARIDELVAPLRESAPTEGRVDQSWYWAAPILIDKHEAGRRVWHRKWWEAEDLAQTWAGDETEGETLWGAHVERAYEVATREWEPGRPPDDLEEVLTEAALGAPAVVALRALSRVVGGVEALRDVDVRDGAASIAWAMRNLFNLPEAIEIVRSTGSHRGDDPYWRQVIEYCISGNLQAVLDEYVHVLPEWIGMADHSRQEMVTGVASAVCEALTLRSASYRMDELVMRERVKLEQRSLRGHFALRFDESSTEDGRPARLEQVRTAFNSPFWPFVLASTSVGQEGLDFHLYCHAVVHWNLPSNPVDLEQREGRVHRYKGHAVRKNVAARCREAVFVDAPDPWAALFDAASAQRGEGESELVPYWVFTGDAGIERYVPLFPLSRDEVRHQALKRTVGAYRLAFGQPRQEDLVAYLQSAGVEGADLDNYRIDLAPPRASRS